MSYDQTIKRHIMNIMKGGTGGCNHLEMKQAFACDKCGTRMVAAQAEYKRLSRLYPDKFIRKESEPDNTKIQLLNEQLQHRIENDSLYNKHVRILQSGSSEDKQKEMKRYWDGFYEKNVGDRRRKTL